MAEESVDPGLPEPPFHFKYVPVEEFQQVLKEVRRERQRKRDEDRWARYVRAKEQEQETRGRLVDAARGGGDHLDSSCSPPPPATNLELEERSWGGSEQNQADPEIPVHFIQQKHRSYVRQVMEQEREEREATMLTENLSRIEDQCTRIRLCLDNMAALLRGPVQEDQEPQAKRLVEFGTRFTRNYLCEIRRQLTSIREMSCKGQRGGPKGQSLFHKFTSAYQTSLQAFLVLEKSSPGLFATSVPPQVYEFLSCFKELCCTTNSLYCDGTSAKLQEMEDMSCLIDSLLRDLQMKPAPAKKEPPPRKKDRLPPKKQKDKYFMYKTSSSFEKLWKKKTQVLARSRLAGNRAPPRPPSAKKKQEEGRGSAPRMVAKERPGRKKTKPPTCEDQVRTMMDIVPPPELSDSEGDALQKAPLRLPVSRTRADPDLPQQDSTAPQEAEATPPIVDDAIKTMISNIMVEVFSNMNIGQPQQGSKETKPLSLEALETKHKETKLKETKLKETKPAESNVKLICLKEDEALSKKSSLKQKKGGGARWRLEVADRGRYTALDYQHYFAAYKNDCALYRGEDRPWHIISRLSEKLLDEEIRSQIKMITHGD